MLIRARHLIYALPLALAACAARGPQEPLPVETLRYPGWVEYHRVLEGAPSFETSGNRVSVNIRTPEPKSHIWTVTWPEDQLPHKKVAGVPMIRIDLLQTRQDPDPDPGFKDSRVPGQIIKISTPEKTYLDLSRCEVHHVAMLRDTEMASTVAK